MIEKISCQNITAALSGEHQWESAENMASRQGLKPCGGDLPHKILMTGHLPIVVIDREYVCCMLS
ncbi:hypothetical protein [Ruminococcus albus]|uniref:hypothetical protein n=1 Tax=Ruminococcus albus TaxID=1264 RepID=UPI000A5A2D4E|nr:hypothetical protein [Ruminococcus albus]